MWELQRESSQSPDPDLIDIPSADLGCLCKKPLSHFRAGRQEWSKRTSESGTWL